MRRERGVIGAVERAQRIRRDELAPALVVLAGIRNSDRHRLLGACTDRSGNRFAWRFPDLIKPSGFGHRTGSMECSLEWPPAGSSPSATGCETAPQSGRNPSEMSLAGARDSSEDELLLAAVARGDESALASLYDRHAGAMLGTALRVMRSRTDAEDLVHDVFVEAWHKAREFDAS